MKSVLNFENRSNFQHSCTFLHVHVARFGLFMKRQFKYVPLELCGLKSQVYFQFAYIIKSDSIGKFSQLQYSYIKLIRCVCFSQYSATDM